MTQRMQSHPPGTFPACPTCRREAKHVIDGRNRPVGGHLMTCSCGDSPKFDSLPEALQAFCSARGIFSDGRPKVTQRSNVVSLQAVRP